MAEKIGYLARSERLDVAVFILCAVDQSGSEGMSQAVEAFCFYAGCLENSVEPFAEVDRSGDISVFVRDERAVLAEVKFLAEVFDHLDGGVVERDVALARGAL